MKIGIDARFIGPGGTGLGKYTEKLIINLSKIDEKNEYHIFLKSENWDFLKLTSKNFRKVVADIPWYTFQEQFRLPSIFQKEGLDLLHVPHFNVPFLYRGKIVVTVHDLIHHQFQQESTTRSPLIFKLKRIGYKFVISVAIHKSSKIITPSNFVREQIIKTFRINPKKVIVTYEAAEEEYFAYQADNSIIRQPLLIYVGNVYPHKNLPKLLDAMQFFKGIKLMVVCPRDVFSQRLNDEISSRHLNQRVEVLGYQKPENLARLFTKTAAYVFPSLSEGFGIPGLNAMAAGLPVVASNIKTLEEIYGGAALYFDPNNSYDIADKIKQILTYPKLRLKLIENGKKQVQKYSWQKMAQETLKVYESVNK